MATCGAEIWTVGPSTWLAADATIVGLLFAQRSAWVMMQNEGDSVIRSINDLTRCDLHHITSHHITSHHITSHHIICHHTAWRGHLRSIPHTCATARSALSANGYLNGPHALSSVNATARPEDYIPIFENLENLLKVMSHRP